MLFGKTFAPRQFEYQPLFYDPAADKSEEEKHRIHFSRHEVLQRKSGLFHEFLSWICGRLADSPRNVK